MESQTKTGKVFLRPAKLNKKWKEVYLSLFPPSSSGVGHLEIRDVGGGGPSGDLGTGVWRHQTHGDKKVKVIRLSELLSVLRLPPNAEACPMENMSAFCVETRDRTLVFAALRDECVDWVDKLCHSSFQRQSCSVSKALHMEENQIYASADEAPQFLVVVQRSDAATRCGLQGTYWLQVEQQSLLLREPQRKTVVQAWPYELLRRYGREKLVFTVETGRRCDCGPGTFSFETPQAEKIFSLIQNTIRQKTSAGNQIQDPEKVTETSIQAPSPLPRTPGGSSMAALLENKLRAQDRRSPVPDESANTPEDSVGQSESAPAPITLMPLPLVPTSRSNLSVQSEAIYADPTDCVPSVARPIKAQYVDPASILPLKAPRSGEPNPPSSDPHPGVDVHDWVYSEVYDKIGPNQKKQNTLQGSEKNSEEPIYSEPISRSDKTSENRETKPDPFAHLYAQVCKAPKTSTTISTTMSAPTSSITERTKNPSEEGLDDVIYENLGII